MYKHYTSHLIPTSFLYMTSRGSKHWIVSKGKQFAADKTPQYYGLEACPPGKFEHQNLSHILSSCAKKIIENGKKCTQMISASKYVKFHLEWVHVKNSSMISTSRLYKFHIEKANSHHYSSICTHSVMLCGKKINGEWCLTSSQKPQKCPRKPPLMPFVHWLNLHIADENWFIWI